MMSSTNDHDPFLQVQADVLTQLATTRSLFTSYLRIRSLTSSSSSGTAPSTKTNPELTSARHDLESSLTTLSEDLSDLVASVRAIESDPYKYGLEIEEVTRRKRLVEEVGGEVEDMREELAKSREQLSASAGAPASAAAASGGYSADDGQEDYAAEFEHQQQLRMLGEQDEALDSVFHTVGNLRAQADTMGRELEEQVGMLEEVEQLTDRVGGKLQTGIKKVGTVLRRNEDGLSSCCIGVLIVVLIILLILVLVI